MQEHCVPLVEIEQSPELWGVSWMRLKGSEDPSLRLPSFLSSSPWGPLPGSTMQLPHSIFHLTLLLARLHEIYGLTQVSCLGIGQIPITMQMRTFKPPPTSF